MRTLVIHPIDPSTEFLSLCYENTNFTLSRELKSSKELKTQVKEHDRIIMLGHGSEFGLFGKKGMAIDSKLIYLLREKDVFCIWCYAHVFFQKYKLRGLSTGMIISELAEAQYLGIDAASEAVEESNKLFTAALTVAIDSKNPLQVFKEYYKAQNNIIVDFNSRNVFYKR